MSLNVTRKVSIPATTTEAPLDGTDKFLLLFSIRAGKDKVNEFRAKAKNPWGDGKDYLFYNQDTVDRLEVLEADISDLIKEDGK